MDEHKSLLSNINSPEDLQKLDESELEQVCNELREFIIDAVSSNPAHFGASLGVVELSVAVHYAFNAPHDKIVWDVGHQAYGHKILTGRQKDFKTNRKYKGISGFPCIFESEYDAFGVGHASTSISAALGMAVAAQQQGIKDQHSVAIIGDGSLTGGMAFEGLNNLSNTNANVLVILNDNNMSIDRPAGGLSDYLVDIGTSKVYNKVRSELIQTLEKLKIGGPKTKERMVSFNNSVKSLLTKQNNIFEGLKIRYFGPVDGHDVEHLVKVLEDLKDIPGPKVLHCITHKGKGFKLAEENQTAWHATSQKFNKDTGERIVEEDSKAPKLTKFQDVFGHTIVELAKQNAKIVGVTPAMPSGCSLNIMMEAMPDRAFDVGIAEQHAVTFSAGMAISGLVPFCNIYSTFMQRAYDQLIHDVAIQKLNVVFCLDRAGIVGADGPTHHGVFDMAYLRPIPNLTIASPRNEHELRNLMYTAQLPNQGPFVIRYPRGTGNLPDWHNNMHETPIGKGEKLNDGNDICFLSIGPIANIVDKAINRLNMLGYTAAHYDLRYLKPLDNEMLHEVFKSHSKIITVEDGCIVGGMGSAIIEFMHQHNYKADLTRIGVPDYFVEHGTVDELYKECGMDVDSIVSNALSLIGENK